MSQRRSGATTYELQDRMGSSVRQTDASRSSTGARAYDAFGMPLSTTGAPQGPFGFAGARGYQGDGDSGLKLLGHRYYDPSTGRFLTRDPIGDGRNWYAYCDGNPLRGVDPDGRQAETIGWGLLIGDPEPVGKIIGGTILVTIGIITVIAVVNAHRRKKQSTGKSGKGRHEKGTSRQKQDQKRTEKGDKRRPY